MKKIRFAGIVLLTISLSAPAWAQTPQSLIQNHLKAIGGAKAYKSVKSLKREGTLMVPAQGIEAPMTFLTKRPNLIRQDLVIQGASFVQAFDGEMAWGINPQSGSMEPTPSPDAAREAILRRAPFDDLFFGNVKKRGISLAYGGKSNENDRTLHHLKVTFADGHVQHRYYDAKSGLLARVTQDQDGPSGAQEVTTEFLDWREVDGVKYPFHVKLSTGPEIIFTSTETNPDLDSSVFSMKSS